MHQPIPKNKCEMAVVVLAAGQGKRMSAAFPDLPKVLVKIGGKPFIIRLLENIKESKVAERIIIVVGHKSEEIKQTLGAKYEYALQRERLGTGHAVMQTEKLLKSNCDNVLVLYGDHPFVKPETLRSLRNTHLKNAAPITMLTANPVDFEDWRKTFSDFGRVIRDKNGKVIKLVEKKDASAEELAVHEVNLGMYMFRAPWLWEHLTKLEKKNAQNEYYLTDLVKMAAAEEGVTAITIEPKEGLGFNTPEQLAEGEKLV